MYIFHDIKNCDISGNEAPGFSLSNFESIFASSKTFTNLSLSLGYKSEDLQRYVNIQEIYFDLRVSMMRASIQ